MRCGNPQELAEKRDAASTSRTDSSPRPTRGRAFARIFHLLQLPFAGKDHL